MSNIILDPLFIFGLKMGVPGAALATVIAWFILLLYVLVLFHTGEKKQSFPFTRSHISLQAIREIVRLGYPQSLGLLAMTISFIFLNSLVSSIGEDIMNAFTLVGRVDYVLITPVLAFSFGMATMVGQNYGGEQVKRVKEIVEKGTLLTMGIVLRVTFVYILVAPALFRYFTGGVEVRELAVRQVRFIALFVAMGAALGICSGSAFQAMAQPIKSFVATCMRIGLITVPLAYLLV